MTNPTRRAIRDGIAQFFGGTTLDPTFRLYRPTPLGDEGLAGVFPYWAIRMEDRFFQETIVPDRRMGALMCVHLPNEQERRIAMGGPVGGIKSQKFAVDLCIYHRAQKYHPDEAQADLDDLIQAIRDRIHGDRTLGGTVAEAGESERGITTQTGVPVGEPATRVEQDAVIQFDATVYPTA